MTETRCGSRIFLKQGPQWGHHLQRGAKFTGQVFGNFNNSGLNISVCVCVRMNSLRITYIIKYNTIFEEKMGFPANLEFSHFVVTNFGFQQQEYS